MNQSVGGNDGRVRRYLELGSDAVVGATAAGVSLGVGPAGTAAVAGVAPFVRSWFGTAVDFAHRQLSSRERLRSSSVLAYALIEAAELTAGGREVRQDDFFDPGTADRSSADEVLEAVLLAAQRDAEEAKVQLLGRMLARIAFDERVDRALANRLIRLVARLSYRQLCLIGTLERSRKGGFVVGPIVADGTRSIGYMAMSPIAVLIEEMWELHREGMLVQLDGHGNEEMIWDYRQINPGRQKTVGASFWFGALMDLSDSVPAELRSEVIEQLNAWVTSTTFDP